MPSGLEISFYSDFSVFRRRLAFLSVIYQCLSKETRFSFGDLSVSLSKETRFLLGERPDHRPTVDVRLLWSYSTSSRSLTAVVSLEGDQARIGQIKGIFVNFSSLEVPTDLLPELFTRGVNTYTKLHVAD